MSLSRRTFMARVGALLGSLTLMTASKPKERVYRLYRPGSADEQGQCLESFVVTQKEFEYIVGLKSESEEFAVMGDYDMASTVMDSHNRMVEALYQATKHPMPSKAEFGEDGSLNSQLVKQMGRTIDTIARESME